MHQRDSFYIGSQTFHLIRRQCRIFEMLNPRINSQLFCLGTLYNACSFHVVFIFWIVYWPAFIRKSSHIATVGSRSFDFPTPAQSLSTNLFVNFCAARYHLWHLHKSIYSETRLQQTQVYTQIVQSIWHQLSSMCYFSCNWLKIVKKRFVFKKRQASKNS